MDRVRSWHRRWLVLPVLASAPLLACSAEMDAQQPVAVTTAALGVCDEDVPADRYVDGIPAFAQCAGSQNTAIYSNDGIETSATQVDSSWVRTQWSGGYQCTELAHRYLLFKWEIDWLPRGNAGEWCETTPPADSGVLQTMEPVHGDLMVLAPGSCGADPSTGHVNVVDVVEGNGRVIVVEQNRANRGTYEQSCGKCFIHVVANTGDGSGGAGIGGEAGTGAMAGMDGSAGEGAMAGTAAMAGTGGMAGTAGAAGSAGVAGSAPTAGMSAGAGAPTTPPVTPPPTTAGTAAPMPVDSMPSATAGAGAMTLPPVDMDWGGAQESSSCAVSGSRSRPMSLELVFIGLLAVIGLRRRARARTR